MRKKPIQGGAKIADAVLFALVLSLVLPPLFAPPPLVPSLSPRISHAVLFFIALLLLFRHNKRRGTHHDGEAPLNKNKTFAHKTITLGYALFTFGVLCLASALICAISRGEAGAPAIPYGTGLQGVLLCALAFFLSAFYEETVYRLYLPTALCALFGGGAAEQAVLAVRRAAAEVISVLLFAFAHKYSGASSIANACVAAIALRSCLVKSRSLAACITVHAVYNILQLLAVNR